MAPQRYPEPIRGCQRHRSKEVCREAQRGRARAPRWILPEGGRGRRLGHRPRGADRPGHDRQFASEQRASSRGDGVGTDRLGGTGARPEEGLRSSGRWSSRRRAGRTRKAAGGRLRTAAIPLCLAAGLFGVARSFQYRYDFRSSRIRARPRHRSQACGADPSRPPQPPGQRRDDHDNATHG
jgi:hypothetical protein